MNSARRYWLVGISQAIVPQIPQCRVPGKCYPFMIGGKRALDSNRGVGQGPTEGATGRHRYVSHARWEMSASRTRSVSCPVDYFSRVPCGLANRTPSAVLLNELDAGRPI
jgi:hypothetical protein